MCYCVAGCVRLCVAVCGCVWVAVCSCVCGCVAVWLCGEFSRGMHQDANQPAEALFATNVKSLRGRDVLSLIVPDHREVFEPVMRRMRELRHAHDKRAAARRAELRQREIARVHRVASSSDSDSDDSSPKSSSDAESKDDPRRRALETSELQIDITTLDGRTVTVDVAVGLADQVL